MYIEFSRQLGVDMETFLGHFAALTQWLRSESANLLGTFDKIKTSILTFQKIKDMD